MAFGFVVTMFDGVPTEKDVLDYVSFIPWADQRTFQGQAMYLETKYHQEDRSRSATVLFYDETQNCDDLWHVILFPEGMELTVEALAPYGNEVTDVARALRMDMGVDYLAGVPTRRGVTYQIKGGLDVLKDRVAKERRTGMKVVK